MMSNVKSREFANVCNSVAADGKTLNTSRSLPSLSSMKRDAVAQPKSPAESACSE